MTYALFIDNERFPPEDGRDWEIAQSLDDVADISGAPARGINFAFPDAFAFFIHSQNPIGARNIQSYLNNYLAFIGRPSRQA